MMSIRHNVIETQAAASMMPEIPDHSRLVDNHMAKHLVLGVNMATYGNSFVPGCSENRNSPNLAMLRLTEDTWAPCGK